MRRFLALAGLTAVLGVSAAAQEITKSFSHQGRTLLYRYDSSGVPGSGRPPGLLLYFHGHNSGTQEAVLDLTSYGGRRIAAEHGLVYVNLASPALRDGTLGGNGTRHWHDEDIPVLHEFLQSGLPAQFSFDSNRVVFWGHSQGPCFLNDFIAAHGASYGGGLYASCGCFNRDRMGAWETPPGFRERFKVVVQATTGDFLYEDSVEAYWFYKYRIGLDTWGDLSEPGGHCSGNWAVRDEDAIGWILGTRGLTGREREARKASLPWQLSERDEPASGVCQVGGIIQDRGDGDALWLPVGEDGTIERPSQNVSYRYQAETLYGPWEHSISPRGVAVDANGNVYVADDSNHRVWRIARVSGASEVIAGTGAEGYSGDGGPAVRARLAWPDGLAVDASGNVFVADSNNNRVRRIDAMSGAIETIAGTGEEGDSGDGGPATQAQLAWPAGLAIDRAGNIFVADRANHRVRRIDAMSGAIETIAGTGEEGDSGDGGPATQAQLAFPWSVGVDAGGNVFVADYENHRVRRIDVVSGVIETIAGTGERGYSGDSGPAIQAQLTEPTGLTIDTTGNIFVAEGGDNPRLRRIDTARGVIETVAGWAPNAAVTAHSDVAVDSAGNLIVVDLWGRLLAVTGHRTVTVALGESGKTVRLGLTTDGLLTFQGKPLFEGARVLTGDGGRFAEFALSQGPDGTVTAKVATRPLLRVSTTTAEPGGNVIETIAGTGERGYSGDGGPATQAQLFVPSGLAVDAGGNLFVVDSYPTSQQPDGSTSSVDTLRRVDAVTGVIETLSLGSRLIPTAVAVDSATNLIVGDARGRVSRIDAVSGVIATVAGTGEWGHSGDGGPATQAQLFPPTDLAVDAGGNVFVVDSENHAVRRIDAATGIIESVTGTGEAGYSGDGGPATQAQLSEPLGLAIDVAGNIFVADSGNHRVRRIDAVSGMIETIAGTGERGYSGDGGPATQAQLAFPWSVGVDAGGNVFVADYENHRVRRIDAFSGVIATVAGTGMWGYSGDGGPAAQAHLTLPSYLAVDPSGNLFVADRENPSVRRVSASPYRVSVQLGPSGEEMTFSVSSGGIVTHAGRPVPDGSLVSACNGNTYTLTRTADGRLGAEHAGERQPVGLGDRPPVTLVRDESGAWRIGGEVVRSGHRHVQGGREYVLDVADGRWRLASHAMRTVGGTSAVEDGIAAISAALYSPSAVAADSKGNLYVADRWNNRIRRIDRSGTITTFAGRGDKGFGGDGGPAAEALLDGPTGVAVHPSGEVFVADTGNHRVRRIDVSGSIETLAGTGVQGYSGDGGQATLARLDTPLGVAVDAVGNVYLADTGNHRVRRIDLNGSIETVAGTGEQGYWVDYGVYLQGDGIPATEARLDTPLGIATDAAGNLYVADTGNQRVRRIDLTGTIETVAGTGERGYSGDGGAAWDARLDTPIGVATVAAGNVYVADFGNRRIRRIDSAGVIATFAGAGGDSGDGGAATEARLGGPAGVTSDEAGNVYIADLRNHRIRRIDVAGTISTHAGTGEPFDRDDGGLASLARFSHELAGVSIDANGNLYVADAGDHTVRGIDVAEMISTVAGSGTAGFGGDDGPATEARLSGPRDVSSDAAGNLYIADTGNHRVRKIDLAGTITTFAGTGVAEYSGEYVEAAISPLNRPESVEVDAAGSVFVLEAGSARVRIVGPSGRIRTVAGNGVSERFPVPNYGSWFDGHAAIRAPLIGAASLAVDSTDSRAATLYLGEFSAGSLIRTVPLLSGRVRTLFFDPSGGPVAALAADGNGNLYYTDGRGIRMIGSDGSACTVADLDEYGISVGGMAVDEFGRIWFSDPEARRVRVLEPVIQ